jgi:rhodanese-related sulfurtransferase
MQHELTRKSVEKFAADDRATLSRQAWLRLSIEEIKMDSTISTKDLKLKLDKKQGITVVETLAPERYREAHLPGALNIPPERIKELAPQMLPNKNAEIITYCTNLHWHASQYAARELAAMGYTNVAHYPDGKQGWMEAGLPVEKAAWEIMEPWSLRVNGPDQFE